MDGIVSLTRDVAEAFVAREERRTGSKMDAYEAVARAVGTTSEWLRKFLSSNAAKEPRLTVGFKILMVYRRVCERVEQAGDRERELKEQIDAALEGAGLLVGRAQGTNSVSAKAGATLEETAEI
jgi:hypothetical protein